MLRSLRLLGSMAVLGSVACGGGSSSTTPTPAFINVVGRYIGTLESNVSVPNVPGGSTSGNCTLSWTITSQTGGAFSGVWELTTGTVPCISSGSVTGTITATGTLSALVFGIAVGPFQGCAGTSASGWTGFATTSSFNVSQTERWSCAGPPAFIADVGRVVAIWRR